VGQRGGQWSGISLEERLVGIIWQEGKIKFAYQADKCLLRCYTSDQYKSRKTILSPFHESRLNHVIFVLLRDGFEAVMDDGRANLSPASLTRQLEGVWHSCPSACSLCQTHWDFTYFL
jgi:hypothetical protein